MKKSLTTLILFLCILLPMTCHAEFELAAPAAMLTDADSGVVLYEHNSDKKMYPASTTKIMTAILTIEKADLDSIATASFTAVNSIESDSSKLFLSENEQMSVRDLLYGLLIASANDAANVLAEHISGSLESFAELMNERALELGAKNTHFTNAHGLHNENHYTTAADLALISRHAMSLPLFAEIVAMRTHTLEPTNVFDEPRLLVSTNHLINPDSPYYCKYARGIKTGYTSIAGSCLVSCGSLDGVNVISVVLGAGTTDDGRSVCFADSKKSLEYGLLTLTPQPLVKEGDILSSVPVKNGYIDEMLLEAQTSVAAHLPLGVPVTELEKREYILKVISAPIKKGDTLGKMEYWYGDFPVGETYMIATEDCKGIPLAAIVRPVISFLKTPWPYIAAVLLIFYCIIKSIYRRKRRRKNLRLHKGNEV